jgi:hypothetical protein
MNAIGGGGRDGRLDEEKEWCRYWGDGRCDQPCEVYKEGGPDKSSRFSREWVRCEARWERC